MLFQSVGVAQYSRLVAYGLQLVNKAAASARPSTCHVGQVFR